MVNAIKVADSLVSDIFADLNKMDSLDRQHQREKLAKELLPEAENAFREIEKAISQGEDASEIAYVRAKAHAAKGNIYLNVALSPELESTFTTVIHNKWMRNKYYQNFVKKWADQALAEFGKSLQSHPTQLAYYSSGMALFAMEKKAEAQTAFEKAQQGDDQETAIDAAKMIARMNEKKGGCFIATACYGSYEHPDVLIFRRWRDEVLLTSPMGRAFVAAYYRVSPPLAVRIARESFVAGWIRKYFLEPLARRLS